MITIPEFVSRNPRLPNAARPRLPIPRRRAAPHLRSNPMIHEETPPDLPVAVENAIPLVKWMLATAERLRGLPQGSNAWIADRALLDDLEGDVASIARVNGLTKEELFEAAARELGTPERRAA